MYFYLNFLVVLSTLPKVTFHYTRKNRFAIFCVPKNSLNFLRISICSAILVRCLAFPPYRSASPIDCNIMQIEDLQDTKNRKTIFSCIRGKNFLAVKFLPSVIFVELPASLRAGRKQGRGDGIYFYLLNFFLKVYTRKNRRFLVS